MTTITSMQVKLDEHRQRVEMVNRSAWMRQAADDAGHPQPTLRQHRLAGLASLVLVASALVGLIGI